MRYCTASPTCRILVEKGRCPTHAQAAEVQRTRYTKANYGRPWRRRRQAFLEANYPWFCAAQGPHCLARNRQMTIEEVQVDHVIPHEGDQTLRDDPDNLQVLCLACHSSKTAEEVGWAKQGTPQRGHR